MIKNVPKTATGFENDVNSLKGDPSNLYQYLLVSLVHFIYQNLPLSTVESIFKITEVRYEQLMLIVKVLKE